MTEIDLRASLLLVALVMGGAAGYGVRLVAAGPAHHPRIDAAGSSPLLGRSLMEMAYWSLQPLARVCVWAGVSANSVTLISLALGAGAGIALAEGHLGVAGALAAAGALGDAVDGLVARATKVTTGGALLDAAVDRYTEIFFLSGLAFHLRHERALLALALLAMGGSFMVSYGSAKAEALRVTAPRGAMRRAERAAWLYGGAILSPFASTLADRAALGPWFGEVPLLSALALVALVANVSAVRRFTAMARAVEMPHA